MVETYLKRRPEAKYYWQLVDIRHAPGPLDKQMYEGSHNNDLRHLVALPKAIRSAGE
jgi:GTP-binding protein EngB required for normal cell division